MTRTAGAERGAVTAELAVGLLTVGVLLLLAGWVASAGTSQVRVQIAAGAAARALARAEPAAAVEQRVLAVAGEGSRCERSDEAGFVRVRVSAPLRAPLLGEVGEVSGEALAPLEVAAPSGPADAAGLPAGLPRGAPPDAQRDVQP